MKKVAILTISDNANLGNRLQNYATQEFLKQQGLEVETIQNYIGYKNKVYLIIKRFLKLFLANKKYKREKNFKEFNKKNMRFSKYIIRNKKNYPKVNDKYDYFITGSDQVWNPKFERTSDIDFLTFAEKKKRISFSASFGVSEIPEDLKNYYMERLNGLNKISVREERGEEIIEELTGRTDVEVLLDPTMLVKTEKWDSVMKRPKELEKINGKKYILNYFLGNLSEERKIEIERIAKENDCEIINILNDDDAFYSCGPSEFLYLEKNAFLICTDSFHSSVFAILFNRPFIVFDREDSNTKMNSRIETLLKKFDLEGRWFKNNIKENQLVANYSTKKALEIERNKAKKFIEEAIKEGI